MTLASGNAIARLLEWLPFRYVGLVSYSLYLWHLPVIWWLWVHRLTFGDDTRGFLLNIALVLTVTLLLSSATYFLVERPALRMKKSRAITVGCVVTPGPPVRRPRHGWAANPRSTRRTAGR